MKLIDSCNQKLENDMLSSAYNGYKKLMGFCVVRRNNNWNDCMCHAVFRGDMSIIEFFIKNGANVWNTALLYAAWANNKHLIDYFIEKGANKEWFMARDFSDEKSLKIFFGVKMTIT